jgi:signal transduction histidine kinase
MLIEQIITNLLDNAIKYRTTGTIEVTITPANAQTVTITVTDQG